MLNQIYTYFNFKPCMYCLYEYCCICYSFLPLCPTESWLVDVSSCPKSRSSKSMISSSRNHRSQAAVASHRTLWDTVTDERRYKKEVQWERIRRMIRDVSGQMQSLNPKWSPWRKSYFEGMWLSWADLNQSWRVNSVWSFLPLWNPTMQ